MTAGAENRVCFGVGRGIKSEAGVIQMLYKKINVELIVVADEVEAVVAELNTAFDLLEEKHTLFGGGIETVAFEHPKTRKRSALEHTIDAGATVAGALRTARESVVVAIRAVI
jgi:D-ribose pyranose/furanose isomerase RbsD